MSADRPPKTLDLRPANATPGSPPTTRPGEPVRTLPHAMPAAPPPPTADRYQFGEEIARGGMGAVYRATDTVLRREVAVKVVQTGSEYLVRRFEDEAYITGQLQHPGVPPVYDLGRLPDGRPFLAMKLIKGQTLDALLKADGPGSGRWLAVFERVCEAVGYAHAHGVIHRDLKPQNVMVGAFGEVQVMDWGLAKVLASSREAESSEPSADPEATAPATAIIPTRDTDEVTRAGSILGTPAYMPPEQAIGAVDQIDARSDVFGLGAILCALLTGQPPYLGADAESTRQLAARGKLADAIARLAACGAEPELVALCRGCLSTERADRPADAGLVAAEVATLRAAAEDRAKRAELDAARLEVQAAEEAKRLRVRRALVWALLIGLAASSVFGLWAKLESDRATAQERETDSALKLVSEEKFETQKALARVTAEQQEAAAARGRTLVALRTLTDQVVAARVGQQATVTDRDRAFFRQVLKLWGEFADARGPGQEADELRAEGDFRVGQLRYSLSEHAEAEGAFRAALAGYERLANANPAAPGYQYMLASAHAGLGKLLADTGRPADAERSHRDALAVQQKLAAAYPAVPKYQEQLASIHHGLGKLQTFAGRPADAERSYRAALAGFERLTADHPAADEYQDQLARTHVGLGILLRAAGRPADAERSYQAALAGYERLTATGPADPEFRHMLAMTHTNLGNLYLAAGRPADAERSYRAALAVLEKLTAEFPAVLNYTVSLCGTLCNLGKTLSAAGRPADAVPWLDRAVGTMAPAVAANPTLDTARQFLRNSYWNRAVTFDRLTRSADAVADWDRVVKLSAPSERAAIRSERANSLVRGGQVERAVAEVAELSNDRGWSTAQWYNFACVYAAASNKLSGKREEYGRRAVVLLRRAKKAGYKDAAHLAKDPDLDPLRGRLDFRWLLATLPKLPEVAPPPRPVK